MKIIQGSLPVLALMQTSLGVYISVPFCKAKCTFCNFASDAFAPSRMDRYIDRLCAEIAAARSAASHRGAQLPEGLDTLYLGGGTPSLLSPHHIRQLFNRLRAEFAFAPATEFTLECAPGQLSPQTLEALQSEGLNRISLGVQSFVDRESAAIGRLHTEHICREEITRIRTAGIDDINLDLIVGLPRQTAQSWLYSLDSAIATGVPHLSVYMLEVDEDSRLGNEILTQGTRYSAATVPSEDDTADWYQLACDRLNAAGIPQYEISNFARPGHQSRHNLKYWTRRSYLGLGLDAHSMLTTAAGAVRFANTSDLDLYSADLYSPDRNSTDLNAAAEETSTATLPLFQPSLPPPVIDRLTPAQAFEESLFLGLRLTAGVSLAALRSHFAESMLRESLPAIEELHAAGLLEWSGDNIALTSHGRIVSNEVFSRLLLPAMV